MLLALARKLCRQFEIEWEPLQAEMMSGDYENLLKAFDREFGFFVTFVR